MWKPGRRGGKWPMHKRAKLFETLLLNKAESIPVQIFFWKTIHLHATLWEARQQLFIRFQKEIPIHKVEQKPIWNRILLPQEGTEKKRLLKENAHAWRKRRSFGSWSLVISFQVSVSTRNQQWACAITSMMRNIAQHGSKQRYIKRVDGRGNIHLSLPSSFACAILFYSFLFAFPSLTSALSRIRRHRASRAVCHMSELLGSEVRRKTRGDLAEDEAFCILNSESSGVRRARRWLQLA